MFKTITLKNVHIMQLQTGIAICAKYMELLKLYSREKTYFFFYLLIYLFLLNQVAIYLGQMSNRC